MTGTSEYQLAKFLNVIIKPYVLQTYMLKPNKQFLDRINKFQFDTCCGCLLVILLTVPLD